MEVNEDWTQDWGPGTKQARPGQTPYGQLREPSSNVAAARSVLYSIRQGLNQSPSAPPHLCPTPHP